MFTLSVAVNCSITIFFAIYCINVEGWKLLYVIGLIEALIFCGLGWLLSGFTVSHLDYRWPIMASYLLAYSVIGTKFMTSYVCFNDPSPVALCRDEPDV